MDRSGTSGRAPMKCVDDMECGLILLAAEPTGDRGIKQRCRADLSKQRERRPQLHRVDRAEDGIRIRAAKILKGCHAFTVA